MTKHFVTLLSLIAAGTLVAACSDSGSDGGATGATSTDTSTTTATGTGTGTGTGAGGGGSTGTGDCGSCWPACFTDMFADCQPSGTCTTASSQSGGQVVSDVCYENGVKAHTVVSGATNTMTYYEAGGGVCFTADSVVTQTDVTATYKDANGATLLTVTTPLMGGVMKVACGGQTYDVDMSSANCKACQGTGGTSAKCATGACTVP